MPKYTCKDHYRGKQPTCYVAWHEWAAKMGKTHKPFKCSECGKYEIWIPRKKKGLHP